MMTFIIGGRVAIYIFTCKYSAFQYQSAIVQQPLLALALVSMMMMMMMKMANLWYS